MFISGLLCTLAVFVVLALAYPYRFALIFWFKVLE